MLNLSNVSILGYKHENMFFGESFRYASRKILSIQGFLLNLNGESGVTQIQTQIASMISGAQDYQDIILNNVNFGKGRIDNLNFEDSNDVKIKRYTITLSIFDSSIGNIPSDLNWITSSLYDIENLKENFIFNVDTDGTYSYEHKINVRYISVSTEDPIGKAKTLAFNLLSNVPAYGLIANSYSGFYDHTGKVTYQETVNSITNEYSVTKSFRLLPTDELGDNSLTTRSLSLDERGITTVTEKGKIQGLSGDYSSALSIVENRISGAMARCQGMVDGSPLIRAIRTSKSINKCTDVAEYEVTFTNDPKVHAGYSWEYTINIEKNERCITTATEQGSIEGFSTSCKNSDKFSQASTGWNSIVGGIAGRCDLNGFLITSSYAENKIEGKIKYSRQYSNDITLGTNNVKRLVRNITDSRATPLINKWVIPGIQEVIQPTGILKLARRDVSIEITAFNDNSLETCLSAAKSQLTPPTGDSVFIDSVEYSYSPVSNSFSMNVSWFYSS